MDHDLGGKITDSVTELIELALNEAGEAGETGMSKTVLKDICRQVWERYPDFPAESMWFAAGYASGRAVGRCEGRIEASDRGIKELDAELRELKEVEKRR